MTCERCGREIVGRRKGAKYCSIECQERRDRLKTPTGPSWAEKFEAEWDAARNKIRKVK